MTPRHWSCPAADGGETFEYALTFDSGRAARLLIVPALFDEANRLRRLTVETMRRLDAADIDTILPDLPGTNESLASLQDQTVSGWQRAMDAAAVQFGATAVLGIRGGCPFAPRAPRVLHYAPVKAANLLRQMIRSRVVSAREAGREETSESLREAGQREGLELAGHRLGAAFLCAFDTLETSPDAEIIAQDRVGGSGLWLRAEPGENAAQADALAAIIAEAMKP
ncbi:alpha/beta hydrolase family protein [Novosphingobium aquimarinum]|uniref:hypothetical protein n=1 Tax=Novosphingobium aquimarinum TaxID=2682494 RepID=UPI0012EB9132|nr:hypothetical protein [Novosphingobium aquimarinum]